MQPAMQLTLPATVESLAEFNQFVRSGALDCGIAPEEIGKLDLVMEEILVNIARYAYAPGTGMVELRYRHSGPGTLRVEVIDSGVPFNPLLKHAPDFSGGLADRPIGGLGVFLVRELVDSLEYRREGGRNILSFQFSGAAQRPKLS